MQATWKCFSDVRTALNSTRGLTQAAIELVRQNLAVGESCEWIGTASVNDFGEWNDGVLIVSDLRIIASYGSQRLGHTYANFVDRVPVPRVLQLQGQPGIAYFQIDGLPVQAVATTDALFTNFREILARTPVPEDSLVIAGAAAFDPVTAMAKLKEMYDSALITDEEFQSKKAEILARM